jgi:hypothetical protein
VRSVSHATTKHTENPERRHAELRRRIERVERQPETEQDKRSPNDVPPQVFRRPATSGQGDGNGRAHGEEQEWKDQVGQGPSVPQGVIERPVDRVPGAGRADEDHGRDREPAERVERIETGASAR